MMKSQDNPDKGESKMVEILRNIYNGKKKIRNIKIYYSSSCINCVIEWSQAIKVG